MNASKNDSANDKTTTEENSSKSIFESIMVELSQAFKDEIAETDRYLKAIRPLKFKRAIDRKAGKITYVAADYGVSYMFKISDDRLDHNFQWYIVYNGKPETWHRKADYMEETLVEIAKNDYPLAGRIYDSLRICPGFDNCYGERCLARTPYAFDGQKRLTCHGKVELGTSGDDFRDAREFFRYFNELIKGKIANGEPLPEKIIVCETKRSL